MRELRIEGLEWSFIRVEEREWDIRDCSDA